MIIYLKAKQLYHLFAIDYLANYFKILFIRMNYSTIHEVNIKIKKTTNNYCLSTSYHINTSITPCIITHLKITPFNDHNKHTTQGVLCYTLTLKIVLF